MLFQFSNQRQSIIHVDYSFDRKFRQDWEKRDIPAKPTRKGVWRLAKTGTRWKVCENNVFCWFLPPLSYFKNYNKEIVLVMIFVLFSPVSQNISKNAADIPDMVVPVNWTPPRRWVRRMYKYLQFS